MGQSKFKNAAGILEKLEQDLKVIMAVDARKITESQKVEFLMLESRIFSNKTFHTGISIKPNNS